MNFLPILTTVLEAETTRYGGTGTPDFTQYGILILSLLAAIAFLAWAFKRFLGGSLLRKADARALQICDVLPLGTKQKLCVVRCYDRSFFLGVSDRQVDLIAELDAAAIGERETPVPLEAKQKDAFLRALKRVQQDHLAARIESEVTVPRAPAKPKQAVRRKAARTAQPVAKQAATRRPVKKAPAKRLDDGRGMLA
jgi:flagellar biosynthetic protein FliO